MIPPSKVSRTTRRLRLEPLESRRLLSLSLVGGELAPGGSLSGQQQTFPQCPAAAVAGSSDGRYELVWSNDGADGSGWGVYAQRFDAGGSPCGDAFPVNTTTQSAQKFPAVAVDDEGDFVVTWSMLARIPLFAELDARSIARLMPYLHAHNYPVHWEIIAEGSEGESMFFIASGSVAVRTAGGEQDLRAGDFFGEIAMLEQSLHQYSFTATSRTRLLRLHREDFLRLERAHPDIGRHIRRVAEARKRADEQAHPEPYGIEGIAAEALAVD